MTEERTIIPRPSIDGSASQQFKENTMLRLFLNRNRLLDEISRLERKAESITDKIHLNSDLETTRRELAELKQEASAEKKQEKLRLKIQDDEFRHLVKMKEGKMKLELDEKIREIREEHNRKMEELRKEHHAEITLMLKGTIADVKETYNEILKRLPNVAVRLKGDV